MIILLKFQYNFTFIKIKVMFKLEGFAKKTKTFWCTIVKISSFVSTSSMNSWIPCYLLIVID